MTLEFFEEDEVYGGGGEKHSLIRVSPSMIQELNQAIACDISITTIQKKNTEGKEFYNDPNDPKPSGRKNSLLFKRQLMKDWASAISYTETFQLDSIDQVDLRVFLEETFSVQFTADQKPFQNLQMILDLVEQKA